jgi:hypothetical protein
MRGTPRRNDCSKVRCGQDANDPRHGLSCGNVNGRKASMRKRRSHERDVHHAGNNDIVDEAAPASEKAFRPVAWNISSDRIFELFVHDASSE